MFSVLPKYRERPRVHASNSGLQNHHQLFMFKPTRLARKWARFPLQFQIQIIHFDI